MTSSVPDLQETARYAETEEAFLVALDKLNEAGGLQWTGVFDSSKKRPLGRARLQWLPQVGDAVSYSINGDTYDAGLVVHVTATRFTTDEGKTYFWSRKRYKWCLLGSPAGFHFAHPRTPSRRDPHF